MRRVYVKPERDELECLAKPAELHRRHPSAEEGELLGRARKRCVPGANRIGRAKEAGRVPTERQSPPGAGPGRGTAISAWLDLPARPKAEEKLTHDDLKKAHEKAVAERFIEEYNNRTGYSYSFKQMGERPDLTYEDRDYGRIGVEVTTAYYDEADSTRTWRVVRAKSPREASPPLVNPDEQLVAFVNGRIKKKCEVVPENWTGG